MSAWVWTRRTRRLAIVATVALALAGCGYQDDRAIRSSIREYNGLLPAAYSRPDPEVLSSLVSPAEKNRVLMYILYLRKQNEILDSRLLSLEFEGVRVESDGSASVETIERWEYRMLDAQTRKPKGGFQPMDYRSRYQLKRESERWVISGLDVDESPSGLLPADGAK